MFGYEEYEEFERFRVAWESVEIVRQVDYKLFTFGDSELGYYLVTKPAREEALVTIRRGEVQVTRPLIITAENASPEFQNFFEDAEEAELARFLMARSARFPNVKFHNAVESERFVSDSVEETTSRINKQLDDQEEDRVAVIASPAAFAGLAVMRYCLERVADSAPDNLTELRERGFLPE